MVEKALTIFSVKANSDLSQPTHLRLLPQCFFKICGSLSLDDFLLNRIRNYQFI